MPVKLVDITLQKLEHYLGIVENEIIEITTVILINSMADLLFSPWSQSNEPNNPTITSISATPFLKAFYICKKNEKWVQKPIMKANWIRSKTIEEKCKKETKEVTIVGGWVQR